MTRAWALLALAASLALSTARAACEDIEQHLNIPFPMTGDLEINLDETSIISCEPLPESDNGRETLEVVVVSGGTLTLKSSSNVRFVNMGFTVMSGSNLVFDMPKTKFGPNEDGVGEGRYTTSSVEVQEGGSATFLGKVVAKEVSNVRSLFSNAGSMEFKKRALFLSNGNVFYDNTGVLKFRARTVFIYNQYLALDNHGSGFVRFSKEVVFDDSGSDFDGASGCSVTNFDSTSEIIFAGPAIFTNNHCSEGAALYNHGLVRFLGKAYFNKNESKERGAAVLNILGTMIFSAAVQFNNNHSSDYGGGIAVQGGDVTFKKSVTFDGNAADSGAGFSVRSGQVYRGNVLFSGPGSLTFQKPDAVRFRNNLINENADFVDGGNCLFGDVADDAVVEGFPFDDICNSATP